DGVFYIPDFVTEDEASRLMEEAYEISQWKELPQRRLQILGGTPHPDGMVPVPLPPHLAALISSLVLNSLLPRPSFPLQAEPNHCLLNEYSSGQGIAPHKDGPLYYPRVAILSLGSPAELRFWAMNPTNGIMDGAEAVATPASRSMLCEHRSLVVFEGEAYHDYWHGILPSLEAARAAAAGAGSEHTAPACSVESRTEATDAATAAAAAKKEQEEQLEGEECSPEQWPKQRPLRLSFTLRRVLKIINEEAVVDTEEQRQEQLRRDAFFERSVSDSVRQQRR
ncbi:unnamed protein product, partial [Phaeothamnion confervicola]